MEAGIATKAATVRREALRKVRGAEVVGVEGIMLLQVLADREVAAGAVADRRAAAVVVDRQAAGAVGDLPQARADIQTSARLQVMV